MGKNISIAEGGVGRHFGPVPRVYTPLQGENAGLCAWVPEDETEAETLHVTKNGTYDAAEMGKYGWTEIEVDITPESRGSDDSGTSWDVTLGDDGPEVTFGDDDFGDDTSGGATITLGDDGPEIDIDDQKYPIDPDDMGFDTDKDVTLSWDEKTKTVTICGEQVETGKLTLGRYDPVTGDLSLQETPSEIIVTAFLRQMIYESGKYIDYIGLQVAGLISDNQRNPIPFEQLKFPVTRASLEESIAQYRTPELEDSLMWSNYGKTFGYTAIPVGTVIIGNIWYDDTDTGRTYTLVGAEDIVYACIGIDEWDIYKYDNIYLASWGEFTIEYYGPDGTRPRPYDTWTRSTRTIIPSRYNSFHERNYGDYYIQALPDKNPFPSTNIPYNGYYLVYDMMTFSGQSAQYFQNCPIQWVRPCDGQTLETSISIEVVEPQYGQAEGGGGQSAGGGAGRN